MVNLESAITERGTPEAKELEVPEPALPLPHLTGRARRPRPGGRRRGDDGEQPRRRLRTRRARRTPWRRSGPARSRWSASARTGGRRSRRTGSRSGGTDLAFLAADGSFREGASSVWAAGPTTPGIAAAHAAGPAPSSPRSGRPAGGTTWWSSTCTGARSTEAARRRGSGPPREPWPRPGADVVVGTHAHRLLGSGWLGDTYVNYGLGNFLWYHNRDPVSGVLRVRIRDGEVVGDSWAPARIGTHGAPAPAGWPGARRRGGGLATAPRVHRPRRPVRARRTADQPPAAEKCW